ncbi:hypothetical protein AMTRI_Chr05g73220 [Amborella trichopoda]
METLSQTLENDPLAGLSLHSLLPRTLDFVSNTPEFTGSHEELHDLLRSKALDRANEIMELAKAVVESNKENKEKENVIHAKERRPGLDRKRPVFSLKPDTSVPSLSFDVNVAEPNVEELQDPAQFFAAFELKEHAERELKRLRGKCVMEQTDDNKPTKTRLRRPSLLGRKAIYKHAYSNLPEIVETHRPSGKENVMKGNYNSSHLERASGSLPESPKSIKGNEKKLVLEGKESDKCDVAENEINELLQRLSTSQTMDEEGTIDLLQKHLQLKEVETNKISLPSSSELIKGADAMPGGKIIPRMFQPEVGSSKSPFTTPTPPKSPLAYISLLQRHVADMRVLNGPYEFSLEMETNQYTLAMVGNQVQSHSLSMDSDGVEGIRPIAHQSPIPKTVYENHSSNDSLIPKAFDENQTSFDGACQSAGLDEVDNTCRDNQTENEPICVNDFPSPFDRGICDTSTGCDIDMDVGPSKPNNSADLIEVEKEPVLDTTRLSNGNTVPHADWFNADAGIHVPREGDLGQSRISTKQKNKEGEHATKRHGKRKELTHRKSLAGAGTKFEGGVRRSTRIKSRPLEYWRGERLIYGRIHDSLATVIGRKYASPLPMGRSKGRKDIEPALKIESFVPEEFTRLVEFAGRY